MHLQNWWCNKVHIRKQTAWWWQTFRLDQVPHSTKYFTLKFLFTCFCFHSLLDCVWVQTYLCNKSMISFRIQRLGWPFFKDPFSYIPEWQVPSEESWKHEGDDMKKWHASGSKSWVHRTELVSIYTNKWNKMWVLWHISRLGEESSGAQYGMCLQLLP